MRSSIVLVLMATVLVLPAAGAAHPLDDGARYVGSGETLPPCWTPNVHLGGICIGLQFSHDEPSPISIEAEDAAAEHVAFQLTTYLGSTVLSEQMFCDDADTTLPAGTDRYEVQILRVDGLDPCPFQRAPPTTGTLWIS